MFPSNSSQGLHPTSGGGSGVTRYASAPAPSALLTTAVGSTARELSSSSSIGFQTHLAHPTALFFPSEAMAAGSQNDAVLDRGKAKTTTAAALQPSFGVVGGGGGASSSSSLVRHKSSPPGSINQLATAARDDNYGGFSTVIRDIGRADHNHIKSRMSSELNFSVQQETISRISKETDKCHWKSKHSLIDASIGTRQWEDTHPMMFSVGQRNHDVLSSLNTVQSQFQFSMGMPSVDKLLNIPQDSVPCKIRAKRGCATHPRSIAERDRRTRISGKLKKLHDLVPNMDKQASYADMLDLAVQHIKTLQKKVQKLNGELESCTCGCKNTLSL